MERKREIPRDAEAMKALLEHNLKRAAEAASRMEQENPMQVAYLAGRIDGLADAMWIKERSA